MQALALQFNLSETTFVLPPAQPGATARVRIFTPTFEMPFAGHPTLGTAHVVRMLKAAGEGHVGAGSGEGHVGAGSGEGHVGAGSGEGHVGAGSGEGHVGAGSGDRVALEMQAGVIPVEARGDRWTLQANAPSWHDPGMSRESLAQILGIDTADVCEGALWVDTGSEQLVIPLASSEAVARCSPDPALLRRHSVGKKRSALAYVWAPDGDGRARVRFFLAKHGSLLEDPGTGSACANLGGWFIARGAPLPVDLTLAQGEHVGRPCRLGLRVDASGRIFVSGRVIALGGGEIRL
jgi:predicted PhzF superfamily epimerase YddE/YHI9